MGNALLTPTIIAKEALVQLENSMVMGNLVHRDYKKEFVKIGSTVTVRKPVYFTASNGATRVNQDVTEQSTTLVIGSRKHVSWNFSTQDLTLTIEEYAKRYVKPAMRALANQVDMDLIALFNQIPKASGTAKTTPNAWSFAAGAGQKLDEGAVPSEDRCLVVSPAAYWAMAGSAMASGININNSAIIKEAWQKGKLLGQFANFETYMDQNIDGSSKLTQGAAYGTTTVNTTSSDGDTTISIASAASASNFQAGDIITISGVNDVNPQSKTALSYLKQFVVTAATTVTSGGTASVPIYPAIQSTGNYQNVSALPQSGATIYVAGKDANGGIGTAAGAGSSYINNLAFHKNALALVMVPLELPDGANFKAQESYNGMSVRVVKDYDVTNDIEIIRLDIMYGVKAIYPELACRLVG